MREPSGLNSLPKAKGDDDGKDTALRTAVQSTSARVEKETKYGYRGLVKESILPTKVMS